MTPTQRLVEYAGEHCPPRFHALFLGISVLRVGAGFRPCGPSPANAVAGRLVGAFGWGLW